MGKKNPQKKKLLGIDPVLGTSTCGHWRSGNRSPFAPWVRTDTLCKSWEQVNTSVEFSGLGKPRGGWKEVLQPNREMVRVVGYTLANCTSFPKEVILPNF